MPRFFMALIVATLLLLGLVIFPVISELCLAAVLAGVLWPVQGLLTRCTRGRRGLAAGFLTIGVILLLVGPVAMMATFVIRDGSEGVRFVSDAAHSEDVAKLVAHLPDATRDVVNRAIARLPRDLSEVVGQSGNAAAAVGAAVAATGTFAFHSALMVIALFFLLVRGDELVRWLDAISPLGRGHMLELLATFKRVSFSVIVSAVITSAVQAASALVGFMIARVPSPVFFALVTFLFAFVPAVGAAGISLVAAVLLLVTGHGSMALFLALWALVVVGGVDHLIKPLLMRRGLEMHGAIVFFSLMGGLAAFGAIGMLVGPLVVALFLALIRIYHRDYSRGGSRDPSVPGLLPRAGQGDRSSITREVAPPPAAPLA